MLDKKYIADYISTEFPDLKNTGFNLNDAEVSAFSENTLLPFLIYQNTVDSKNRIIELYLQENSASIHFLPFYVAVGFYRKAVNKALTAQRFKTEKFEPGKKSVRYNSSICSITGINFLNRTIQLRSGISEHELLFEDDYKLKWDSYKNSADIRERLSAFAQLDNASHHNIFTLPVLDGGRNHEGVILFSSVSKFSTLLRNLRVAGHDLRQHLNIQTASFAEDAIKLSLISAPRTKNQPVTILVARNDSVMAFNHIIEAGKNKIDHLNTVIIDDFDELLKIWERSGVLDERISELKEIYFDRLGTVMKDIYLICKNRNFSVHEWMAKYGIRSEAWQVTPREKIVLDGLDMPEPLISVKRMTDKMLESIQTSAEHLLHQWKELGRNNFCNGQTIRQIGHLYNLRDKLLSFYKPETFLKLNKIIDQELDEYQRIWFSNNQDEGLIQQTRDFLASQNISGGNLTDIRHIIAQNNTVLKKIVFVTNNTDKDDRSFFESELALVLKETSMSFCTAKEFLQIRETNNDLPDLVIYLSWNKDVLNNALVNLLSNKQVFLVNKKSSKIIINHFNKSVAGLAAISGTDIKYNLLNLDPPSETSDKQDNGLIALADEAEFFAETDDSADIEDISEYVHGVLNFFNNDTTKATKKGVKSYFVFFEDGTHVEWPENKSVFYFEDHAEGEKDSVQKEVQHLVIGDLVLLPKNRAEMKSILKNALSQDEKMASSLKYDEEWRKKINNCITLDHNETDQFRDLLIENGFSISSGTIRNWIDGETIQPHNFKKLLLTLIKMDVIEDEMKERYLIENRTLKRHKIMFVRSAVRKLIFNLKGIHYGEDGIFDEKLLNAFVDHVDIKPVLGIYIK